MSGQVTTIFVNDELRPLNGTATVAALAAELRIGDRKGVAIAVNGCVVARAAWPERALTRGDRVLVIRATQGG